MRRKKGRGTVKLAICDDERIQRQQLTASVTAYFRRECIPVSIQEYESAEQLLLEYDTENDFDIVLLDIKMGGMDGISLANELRSKNEALAIIFITGMTDYIFEGFRLNAINYLLKPVEEEKLWQCLEQAVTQRQQQEDVLILRVDKELIKIRKSQILRVESDGHYLKVITDKGAYRTKRSMKEVEQELPAQDFYKISRSDLLHLHAVERITRKDITMINGEQIPIPKGKYKEISEAFLNCHFRREAGGC